VTVMNSGTAGLGTTNGCAGEDQNQFIRKDRQICLMETGITKENFLQMAEEVYTACE
jgi:hypothetical protein